MDASDLEAPSGTQTCLGVSPIQPRILHPNWTLTYGLCKQPAGCVASSYTKREITEQLYCSATHPIYVHRHVVSSMLTPLSMVSMVVVSMDQAPGPTHGIAR